MQRLCILLALCVCGSVWFWIWLGTLKDPNHPLPVRTTKTGGSRSRVSRGDSARSTDRLQQIGHTDINSQRKPGSRPKYNVLLLGADDLRAEIGPTVETNPAYNPNIRTPNLDKLARVSVVLKHAYAQYPLCDPSRTSMLTSRRPDTTRVYSKERYFRTHNLNFTTMPQYFKQHGYRTVGMGKVFHHGMQSGFDDPPSWSEPFHLLNSSVKGRWIKIDTTWTTVSRDDRKELPLPDDFTTKKAIDFLREVAGKQQTTPFFLSVGFYKPHYPIAVPEQFLDMYPLDSIRLPTRQSAPVNMPSLALKNRTSLTKYRDLLEYDKFKSKDYRPFAPDVTRSLRRAYYAAISYIDSLYGVILKELEKLGLDKNTIVVLWSDHGFHVGESGIWGKWSNFELSLHVPLIIRIPGVTDRGINVSRVTEMVDLFPTLVEAAGLPRLPLCPVNSSLVPLCREGLSLMPLIRNPSAPWKQAAFSQTDIRTQSMGYSMRTARYRYTEWPRCDWPAGDLEVAATGNIHWNDLRGVELYDHKVDPEETVNRAGLPQYRQLVEVFSRQLRAGWRHQLPR